MAAAFDFKKEYKDLYLPKTKPMLIDVPAMTFIAVAGSGNPNEDNGDYAEALGLLYAFSFTVKMAKMGDWQPDGYFDYVVPPLEGLWWGGGFDGGRIEDKDALNWVSMICQPDFVRHLEQGEDSPCVGCTKCLGNIWSKEGRRCIKHEIPAAFANNQA